MGVKRLSEKNRKPKPRRTANHCLYFLRNFYNISRLWVCQKTFPEKQTTTLRRKCESIRPMSAVNAFLYFPRPPAIPVAEKEAGHQNGIIILRMTGLEIYLDHKVHDDQDVQDDRVDQQVSVDMCGHWPAASQQVPGGCRTRASGPTRQLLRPKVLGCKSELKWLFQLNSICHLTPS